MKIFLDDIRVPIDCATYMYQRNVDCKIYHFPDWYIIRTYRDFVVFIKENGIPDMISFDYDLDDSIELRQKLPIEYWFNFDENRSWTGLDCLKWVVRYCSLNNLKMPICHFHTANPDGLEAFKKLYNKISN